MTYGFESQLEIGQKGEKLLDAFFSKDYAIKEVADLEMQKRGIDRYFRRRDCKIPAWFTVEYKTDFIAQNTNMVFIETAIICDGKRKPGWALKLFSQALVYFIPGCETAYLASSFNIKHMLPHWCEYHTVKTTAENTRGNSKWVGEGLLVPVCEFKSSCCYSVYRIKAEDDDIPM